MDSRLVYFPVLFSILVIVHSSCPSDLDLVIGAEGFETCPYSDTMQIATICYGFNLERSDSAALVQAVGGNYPNIMNRYESLTQLSDAQGCLNESQCRTLLDGDLVWARDCVTDVFGSVCECEKSVLTDMCYNLGKSRINGFSNMIAAVKQGNWSVAADEAQDSTWCNQVKSRCTRNVGNMRKGCNW